MLVLLTAPPMACAGEGGGSNYIPGFYGDLALAVAPPDGVSIRNDLLYATADGNGSVRSGQVELSASVDLLYNYLTILYNPGIEFLGADVAIGATPAIGSVDLKATLRAAGLSLDAEDDQTSIADLTLAAYLYWRRQNFHLAWANYVVAPVGSYDVDDLANPGLNYWTFETDLMATYLNEETGQDYSVVIGYGYNTENDDTDYKTGDELHVDFVLNQHLGQSFGVGINGFYFRQLSGDSGAGAVLGSFRGEGAGIGPVLYWNTSMAGQQVYFSAKWLHQFHSENRLETDYVYASFSTSF